MKCNVNITDSWLEKRENKKREKKSTRRKIEFFSSNKKCIEN
jgi:hypothetical protein